MLSLYGDLSQYDDYSDERDEEPYNVNVDGTTLSLSPLKYLSEKDRVNIQNKKTCAYQSLGRFDDYLSEHPEAVGNYYDIENKDICFNAEIMEDLKGYINCGYNEITLKKGEQTKIIKSCGYIAEDNLPSALEQYMKLVLIDYMQDTRITEWCEGAYIRFPGDDERDRPL